MNELEKEEIINEFIKKSVNTSHSYNIGDLFKKGWHFILFYQSINILMLILSTFAPYLIILFLWLNGIAFFLTCIIRIILGPPLRPGGEIISLFVFGILSLLIPVIYFNILKINIKNIALFLIINIIFFAVFLLLAYYVWAGLMQALM
jgi:hypothetical protein